MPTASVGNATSPEVTDGRPSATAGLWSIDSAKGEMNKQVVLAVLVILLGSACGDNITGSPRPSETTTVTESSTTEPSAKPFAASVNDVIAQVNLQLPLLVTDEPSIPLPVTISEDGTFGGPVTSDTEIRLVPEGNAFEPVAAIVVRTTGTTGSVETPARLLSGIGASLYTLSTDAITAFSRDVLPRLSALNQSRTTITVGSFYDLTIVVVNSSKLTYIFTPVGVAPAADLS